MPSASFMRRISWPTTPSEIGSRPANGSSYITSIGSSAIARASATRRAIPPESSEGISRAAPRRPTACSFISTRSRTSSSGRSVCSRSANAMFSYTDMSVNSAPNWNSIPNLRRITYSASRSRSGTDSPPTSTRPDFGFSWPPMSRRIVVLPQPEPPMIATTPPRGIGHRDAGEHRPPVVGERHVGELDGVLGVRGGRDGRGRVGGGHRIDIQGSGIVARRVAAHNARPDAAPGDARFTVSP